mmetsp:Transcript_126703/g.289803  ORF Transcript_126703/g.289803 Transcript_126703/m.289803 type:complete len:83 (-) Transcript_126703:363-611(-)
MSDQEEIRFLDSVQQYRFCNMYIVTALAFCLAGLFSCGSWIQENRRLKHWSLVCLRYGRKLRKKKDFVLKLFEWYKTRLLER